MKTTERKIEDLIPAEYNPRTKTETDWRSFCMEACRLIRCAGKTLYVKKDLRPYAPDGFLNDQESDSETVFLPDRPSKQPAMF